LIILAKTSTWGWFSWQYYSFLWHHN